MGSRSPHLLDVELFFRIRDLGGKEVEILAVVRHVRVPRQLVSRLEVAWNNLAHVEPVDQVQNVAPSFENGWSLNLFGPTTISGVSKSMGTAAFATYQTCVVRPYMQSPVMMTFSRGR